MKELIFGGLLYLTGVMTVLAIQPKLMFTEAGGWKEFGIGRNPHTHTWMPFWLFCIFWAILSYAIVQIFIRVVSSPTNEEVAETSLLEERPRRSRGLRASLNVPPAGFGNMKKGTYVLNEATSRRKGVPHYVYYGEEPLIEQQL